MLPDIVNAFAQFVYYRTQALAANTIDLSRARWFYPTALLPLGQFIRANTSAGMDYIGPSNKAVNNYLDIILGETQLQLASENYCPLAKLPRQKNECEAVLQHLYRLQDNGKKCGGETAFKFLIGELVDNVYEHSSFSQALVMAQGYPRKRFVELSFFDDGISIPGAFETAGLKFSSHPEAIADAINGLSTKSQERGYGLGDCMTVVSKGYHGEALVVSSHGAIYLDSEFKSQLFSLTDEQALKGTLVSLRLPLSSNNVDIYAYIR